MAGAATIAAAVALSLPHAAVARTAAAHAAVTEPGGTTPSGTDASCPAAGSGSGPLGAPTGARAIGGDASATVVWCPPVTGAGSVVSYTITSSGGRSVTADVPNDWAIIDGLHNGTAYTFTVTATAADGSTSSAAVTGAVTPAQIAPPANVLRGRPETVSYDQSSLLIGGKRTFITAGQYDPWRTPSPSLWLDRLQKMKAEGYNAVSAYFDWDYHSPSPGVYDFSGVRDMNEFLNLAQQVGLYVIARPGPNINAETDGGGLAAWMLTEPNGNRNDSQPFLSAAAQWFSQIDPIIGAHQITRGGDVITYQIENADLPEEPLQTQQAYMASLESKARSDGIDVPFTFNSPEFTSGTGAVNISGQDSYPLFATDCGNSRRHFGNPPTLTVSPGEPFMTPEEQNGSLENWGAGGYGDCYTLTGPDFENVYYKYNIAQGITIQSDYMGAGGTNWGWLPYPQGYTSYDYGAPIRETGELGTPVDPNDIAGSKYGEDKLINDFETSVAPLTKTVEVAAPVRDNAAVAAMSRANPDDRTQFIYLRQASAASTATTQTRLSLNLNQDGSYTYDDTSPALSYSGAWSQAGPGTAYYWDYGQTESSSAQAGASVSATFNGTTVQWIGSQNTNGGIADVYIDGTLAGSVDTYTPAGKQYQQMLFSKTGLAAGSHTLQIVVTGQKNAASSGTSITLDAVNVPGAAQQAGIYPVVPQQGSITLAGRDAKMLLANYDFAGEHLVYSTSELMHQTSIGGQATALLYGTAGTDGETVLRYATQPTVKVLSGSVQQAWDPARGDLRLDYTHQGLAEVQVTGGGRPPMLLLIGDTSTAEGFWPEQTSAGPALVQGGYLVRTAAVHGAVLALTGDTSSEGPLTVWAPGMVHSVTWNGQGVAVTRGSDGALHCTIPGPAPVSLPALTNWRFTTEAPVTQTGFDDSSWTLADHAVTTYRTTATPVLYAADYGYDHGFVWYRGHFTAAGSETGVTLTADGIAPTGAFSVWLNGTFLGSHTAAGTTQATFSFPPGALRAGQDNVIAVLTENTGNPEGSSAERAGLYSASLNGSSAPVTWRLMGDTGGTTLQDPVRGPVNPAGLYGSNHGWDLPGYPDQSWQHVTLPDSWASRGVQPGAGWYRTTFSLNLPQSSYVPVDVQIGGPGPGAGTANYRAFIFVNGWLIGVYVNNIGPQHQFYVPAGILNEHGGNTLALAVWGLDATGAGLDNVSLVAAGNQAGGLEVQQVPSPGYNAGVYGPPSRP